MAPPDGQSVERAAARRGLSRDQVAEVLRRAAELDGVHDDATLPDLVAPSLVEEAGVEAGLTRDAVRRALAEVAVRGGDVEPEPAGTGRLVARRLTVVRRVPGSAAEVRPVIERFLRRQVFVEQRVFANGSRWVPRRGLFSELRRGQLDLVGRDRLRGVRRVDLRVVDDPAGADDHVVVRLDLDVTTMRHRQAGALAAGATAGVAATGGLVGAVGPEALLLGGPVTAALAAGGYVGGRVHGRRSMARIEVLLDGLLDRVEHGWSDDRRPRLLGPPAPRRRVDRGSAPAPDASEGSTGGR